MVALSRFRAATLQSQARRAPRKGAGLAGGCERIPARCAARAKFVALDLDGGLARFAMDYPTEDLQLHAARIVQHGRPVHRQSHSLALLERLLGGEPDFPTADFERFAHANGGDPAALHALVADVLLNRKPSSPAPPIVLAGKVVHR